MTEDARGAIREMVDRETAAWDARDAEALLDLFHEDMVWPWPPTPTDHDPQTWLLEYGRFDRERWGRLWRELFESHELARNDRETLTVKATDEGDGGFAVVDVDTRWRHRETGEAFRWEGRATKVYARVDGAWKMTAHWGLLAFDGDDRPVADPTE